MNRLNLSIVFTIFLMLFSLQAAAVEHRDKKPRKDTISMTLSVEDWAKTKSAKVFVRVDANLKEDELGRMHENIKTNLSKLAESVDWHVTRFDRRKDQSGLEQVQVQAEARLASSMLSGLREEAKSISKPGETYRISDIQFVPSLSDIEGVKSKLREQIYNLAQQELGRINKTYPGQTFKIRSIDFNPVHIARPEARMSMMQVSAAAPSADLEKSDKVYLRAIVKFAAEA